MHPLLLERYAADIHHQVAPSDSRWLAWTLAQLNGFHYATIPSRHWTDSDSLRQFGEQWSQCARRCRATGVEESVAAPLLRLLELAANVADPTVRDERAAAAWVEHFQACCALPGLTSLVAVRHAISLLFLDNETGRQLLPHRDSIAAVIRDFHSGPGPDFAALDSAEDQSRYRASVFAPAPDRVRLAAGAAPVEIAELLARHVRSGEPLPFPFLRRWSIEAESIESLVRHAGNALGKVFERFGPSLFPRYNHGHAWLYEASSPISSLLRKDAPADVKRCVLALFHMLIYVHVPPEALLDAIRCDEAGRYADSVFGLQRVREITDMDAVSRSIQRDPERYATAYRKRAADFLARRSKAMPPLRDLRQRLGLDVRT